jgi:exodeoxyribonuclease V alpha subunit
MDTSHFPMLRREVLFTAVTRAKQRSLYVGSPKAFYMALSNTESVVRHSGLFEASPSSAVPPNTLSDPLRA